jgi:Fe(3+) dicitrate transport protein
MVYRTILLITILLLPAADSLAQQQDSTSRKQLKEVRVTDKATEDFDNLHQVDGMKVTVGKKSEVINVEQLTVNKATNNTRQIYAKVAGLNIFENDGSGLQLSIGGRGLDPNRTSNFNVRQNGYDISADALGYPESYYTPPADAISRIEIIKGAASLQFGTQFGGLLNFKLKQPGGDKPIAAELKQTIGPWGFFGSFNSINGTVGKLSYYAYAHYKRGDGWRPNSQFQSLNTYAALRYQVNTSNTIGLEFTHLHYLAQQPGGLDDQMFANDPRQSNRPRNWFAVDWNLLNLEWNSQLSAKTKWQTQVYGLLASRKAIGFRPNRPAQPDNGGKRDLLTGNFKNIGLESRILHHYSLKEKQQTLLTGIRVYNGHNHSKQGDVDNGSGADFRFEDESRELRSNYKFPNLNLAAFAENIFRITDRWSITPGIRAEYILTRANGTYHDRVTDLRDSIISDVLVTEHRKLPRTFLLAAVGSSYNLHKKTELYGNISQNYRSVTFSDIQVVNASFEIDPNIQDEKGWSVDLGIRGSLGDKLRFDISGFYLFYGNRIGEYFLAKSNGQVIRKRGNVGEAQIYGLESFLELDVLKFFPKVKQHYGLSIYSNLALTNAHYTKSPIANIIEKRVEYVPVMNWKTGLQAHYKTFKLTIQMSRLSDQYTDATNEENSGYSAVNGILKSYTLLDVSAGWQWKRYSIDASLNNAANAAYFTRRATGYPGPGIIPGDGRGLYVTVGLKL